MRFVEPSYEILACPDGEEVLRLLELAARTCYKSEEKAHGGGHCLDCAGSGKGPPRLDDTKRKPCSRCRGTGKEDPSSYTLIRKILKSGHHSVIEHMGVTVRFICNRGVTHELVRHRLVSYSQESTRYCNYSKDKHGGELNIIEPSYRPYVQFGLADAGDEEKANAAERRQVWEEALDVVEGAYLKLIELGEKPQEARDILPIGLKTEIVTTANLREWRHIFSLRCSPRAHPQIRELMVPLRAELRQRIPLIFDDEV